MYSDPSPIQQQSIRIAGSIAARHSRSSTHSPCVSAATVSIPFSSVMTVFIEHIHKSFLSVITQ